MLKQYNVLTKCIAIINIPVLPHIEKLKLEIQLILMKQLLLMQPVEGMIRGVSHSESEFDFLLAQIEEICISLPDDAAGRLAEVTAQAKRMTEELKHFLMPEEKFPVERPQPEQGRLWR